MIETSGLIKLDVVQHVSSTLANMGDGTGQPRSLKRKLDTEKSNMEESLRRPAPFNPYSSAASQAATPHHTSTRRQATFIFARASTTSLPASPSPQDAQHQASRILGDEQSGSHNVGDSRTSDFYSTPASSTYQSINTNVSVVSAAAQEKLLLSDRDTHVVEFVTSWSAAGGGFCEIYVAFHRPTGRKLAMKRPRTHSTTETLLRRFRREAGVWSTLDHINILPFFGTMEILRQLYLVSPWMEHGDLLSFVQDRSRYFDPADRHNLTANSDLYLKFSERQTIRDIAAGLEYLHSLRIVHGDIKAKNVLLDNTGCAKICDFGLTKRMLYDVTSKELKGVGTVRWQSPELLNNAPKSPESDIYAFAMTIVEILTCTHPLPYLEQTAFLVAIVVRNERPEPLPRSRLDVSFDTLWALAAWCWKIRPVERPSAKEVLRVLDLEAGKSKLHLSTHDFPLMEFGAQIPTKEEGFFDLFVGVHQPTQARVAVKRLKRGALGNAAINRIQTGARSWAKLDHPNILSFFGNMSSQAHIYILSLWASSGNLRTFLQNYAQHLRESDPGEELAHPLYSNFDKFKIIHEIASGLEYLHSQGIVHGKLKSKNVLLGVDGSAKLCDFGLPLFPSLHTSQAQILAQETCPKESDIPSFGYLIYEISEPHQTYFDFTFAPEDAQILRLPWSDSSRDPLKEKLKDLVSQSWRAESSQRPSAAEIVQQLRGIKMV